MKQKFFLFSFLILISLSTYAQNYIVSGIISDQNTSETLPGVNIILDETPLSSSDFNGHFEFKASKGKHSISFRYIGYQSREVQIELHKDTLLMISLSESLYLLDEIVVSAGRHNQKMSDATVSVLSIKPAVLEERNTTDFESLLRTIPGVFVMDGQSSIRGGNGYAYGVGSRVLLMVDDMPMLTGASGETKWNFVPVEMLDRIEVLKGASSALYGSSALNGVVSLYTVFPGDKPETKVSLFGGYYNKPRRKEIIWWEGRNPVFGGLSFMHSRKIGQLDMVVSGFMNRDESHKQDQFDHFYRGNLKLRYRSKNIKGLSFGVNSSYMKNQGSTFLIWRNGTDGVLKAKDSSLVQSFNNHRMTIDPYIQYFPNPNTRHVFRTRFFYVDNINNTQQSTTDRLLFSEYQFQKTLPNSVYTIGISGDYNWIESLIFGSLNRSGYRMGIYGQYEKKFGKLLTSAGGRFEYLNVEGKSNSKPVFRIGASYPIAKHSFLRASFGQGYRTATVAEKFTLTEVGAIKIFPNADIGAESGWSLELGLKQEYMLGSSKGIIDIAFFTNRYSNMIEFGFGQHYPDSLENPTIFDYFNYTGFRAQNISNAEISGVDFNILQQNQLFGHPLSSSLGYTFTLPINPDIESDQWDDKILKYRFYHNFKLALDYELNKGNIGVVVDYFSKIINIDTAFEDSLRSPDGTGLPIFILPGLYEYRQQREGGEIIFDAYIGYRIGNHSKIQLHAKNLLNREYMLRPGDIQPPRNISIQYILKLKEK